MFFFYKCFKNEDKCVERIVSLCNESDFWHKNNKKVLNKTKIGD